MPTWDEAQRIEALRSYALLDTPPEAVFDELISRAAQLLEVPIVLISLVDGDRQWFKAAVGLDLQETSLSSSFCAQTILGEGPLVVEDASHDPRFADNPLVAGAPGIRFYAGTPLTTPDGLPLGALCLIDVKPRGLAPRDQLILEALASQTEVQFELRKQLHRERQLQEELARRNEILRQFFTLSIDVQAIADADGKVVQINPPLSRLIDRDPQEVQGRRLLELVHPDDAPALEQALARLEAGPQPLDCRLATPPGAPAVHVCGRVGRDMRGAIFLAASDVTAERELQHQQELTASLVANSSDAIVSCDLSGRVTAWNAAAERLYDYAAEAAIGRPLSFIEPGEAMERALASLTAAEVLPPRQAVQRTAGGGEVEVSLSHSLVRAPSGELVGFAMIARDIGALKAVERIKDEFISVVSHELRTPLTSIRGALGLIAQAGESLDRARREQLLGVALSNSERLVKLINDILDLEKMSRGGMALRRAPWSAEELVDRALAAVDGLALSAGVVVESDLDVPDERPLQLDGDRVVQLLVNLLSNAIKFSERGGLVWLGVRIRAHALELAVSDRGPGIAADQHRAIFDRFSQVDSADTRERGGSGLGLSICKAIAELHGGEIAVESEPGQGATFRVWLPLAPRETSRDGVRRPCRVLLVEDDEDLGTLLASLIEREGYCVHREGSLAGGIGAIEQARPDVVVLDLGLPDGCGLELLNHLAADDDGARVVIISGSERRHPGDSAVVDWVEKPFDERRLRRALALALSDPRPAQALLIAEDGMARVALTARLRRLGAQVRSVASLEEAARLPEKAYGVLVLSVGERPLAAEGLVTLAASLAGQLPPIVLVGEGLAAAELAALAERLGGAIAPAAGDPATPIRPCQPADLERWVAGVLGRRLDLSGAP